MNIGDRMFDFLRAACVVPDIRVADTEYNLGQILEKLKNLRADVIVFPELCLTGYTCGDLFFQETLRHRAAESLGLLAKEVREENGTVVVGLPVELAGQLYNCAAVLCGGKICGIVPKTFLFGGPLPEERWFSAASALNTASISSAVFGMKEIYEIPVGRNLLFTIAKGVTMGVEIGSEPLAPLAPGMFAALNGAQVIVNPAADCALAEEGEQGRERIRLQSERLRCAYLVASAGRTESTTDFVFSGKAVFAENGIILKQNEVAADTNYILCADIDVGLLKAERRKGFWETAALYGRQEVYRGILCSEQESASCGQLRTIKKRPFVPEEETIRSTYCRDVFFVQASALQKRLQVTGCRAVVGVSGGLDSTLALLVAVEAMRRLGKPASEVYGITMPCFGTSTRTYKNSIMLMEALGVTQKEIVIRESVQKHFLDIGHDESVHDLTYENSQARERTQVLMDFAGSVGGLVVGTGDLSELALGWCTYNGDHMSMYGVNGSIPKTLIRWVIDRIAQEEAYANCRVVLADILDTPISPELLPPDEAGTILQKTEDLVGPYVLHDFFLYYVLRYGFEPEKIYYLACRAFEQELDAAVIKKWLVSFYRRFFTQQFKRSCMPDGVKATRLGLSPRGDWQMPSDASAAAWIKKAESL